MNRTLGFSIQVENFDWYNSTYDLDLVTRLMQSLKYYSLDTVNGTTE